MTTVIYMHRLIVSAIVALTIVALNSVARADAVPGEVAVSTEGGFARLVFKLDEEVGAKVSMSGTVLIIEFQRPIVVPVEGISSRAPDYFSAARLDPDG